MPSHVLQICRFCIKRFYGSLFSDVCMHAVVTCCFNIFLEGMHILARLFHVYQFLCYSVAYPRPACTCHVSTKVLQFTKGCHLMFGNQFTDPGTRSSRSTCKQVSRIVTQRALRLHYVFKCQWL